MKKLFTLFMAIFTIVTLNAQVVEFTVNGTPAYKGAQGITYSSGATWKFQPANNIGKSWTADLVMAKQAGIANDSLASFACDSLANGAAMKGKIALTRRGGCEFGVKAFQSQKAGAIACVIANREPGAPIGIGGGAKGLEVDIPTVMISWELMQLINADLKAGKTVNITISVPNFYNPNIAYAYATPLTQVVPLENAQVIIANNSGKDVTNFKSTITITEPDAKVVKIDTTYALLENDSIATINFPAYKPTKKGKYKADFTIPALSSKTLSREFILTDDYYALDNGVVNGASGTSAAQFNGADKEFHVGNTFVAGKYTTVTHVSFAIRNPATMLGEEFAVFIYELPEITDATVLGDFAIVPTKNNIFPQLYTVTDQVKVDEQILIKLDENVNLEEGKQYVVMIQYIGNTDTKIPQYTFAGTEDYSVSSTFVYSSNAPNTPATGTLFTGGFSGDSRPTVRMHVVKVGVDAKDLPALADKEVSLFPVPTTNELNVKFDLSNPTEKAEVTILDLMGRTVFAQKYTNLQKNTIQVNTSNFANGSYIFYVKTDKGFDSRTFTVAK